MKYQEIAAIIKKECKKYGIRFYQGRGKTVRQPGGGVRSNGYFAESDDDQPSVLALATNNNSLDVLIHEYCHMQQCLEQIPEWTNLNNRGHMWDWIMGGNEATTEELNESFLAYFMIELDCEMRSVELHKKWQTGKNIEEYIQKANAYLLFYFFVRNTRQWYASGQEPYSLPEVWQHMPKTFEYELDEQYEAVKHLFSQCVS